MRKFSGVQFSCHYAFNTNCDFYCKPSMKGGHRHNHLSNHELRLMHTKNERKCIRKFLKK